MVENKCFECGLTLIKQLVRLVDGAPATPAEIAKYIKSKAVITRSYEDEEDEPNASVLLYHLSLKFVRGYAFFWSCPIHGIKPIKPDILKDIHKG